MGTGIHTTYHLRGDFNYKRLYRNSHPDMVYKKLSLRKILYFHLIFSCGNFVERNSFRIVSVETVPFHKISTPGN